MKLGGDKGGDVLNTFKMNFQICNVPKPNSVHNTCVFSCFEAADSVTNLHSALDRFGDQVEQLMSMKWRYKCIATFNKSMTPHLYELPYRELSLRVFLCGDYEFLSRMYGLSGASGMLIIQLSVQCNNLWFPYREASMHSM